MSLLIKDKFFGNINTNYFLEKEYLHAYQKSLCPVSDSFKKWYGLHPHRSSAPVSTRHWGVAVVWTFTCLCVLLSLSEIRTTSFLWLMHSVQFSRSVVSDSLRPHESQHARPPCPSPTPRVYSNSCQLSQWCHPTISSSVAPFSSCPQSFSA